MPSLPLLSFIILGTAARIFAHPLHSVIALNHYRGPLRKRSPNRRHTLGIGIGIAILLSLLLMIAFDLGRRRERTGSWYCWKETTAKSQSSSNTLSELEEAPEPSRLKSRISSPFAPSSSAPVELRSPRSPVEAQSRPCVLELPSKEIFEMGQPSPSLSPERASWVNRTTWWNKYSDRRKEINAKNEKSQCEIQDRSTEPPSYPEAALLKRENEKKRKSSGSGLMDWHGSGLEYVRRMYGQKKNELGVEGTPWY